MNDLTLHPIRTEEDYRAALERVESFFDLPEEPSPDSAEGAFFDGLVTLIEAYERKHYPMASADPIEAIKFRLEQGGLSMQSLKPAIGQSNRVYEVLNRKRKLTLPMIRKLHILGIPAEVLIADYPVAVCKPKSVTMRTRPATSLGKQRNKPHERSRAVA